MPHRGPLMRLLMMGPRCDSSCRGLQVPASSRITSVVLYLHITFQGSWARHVERWVAEIIITIEQSGSNILRHFSYVCFHFSASVYCAFIPVTNEGGDGMYECVCESTEMHFSTARRDGNQVLWFRTRDVVKSVVAARRGAASMFT